MSVDQIFDCLLDLKNNALSRQQMERKAQSGQRGSGTKRRTHVQTPDSNHEQTGPTCTAQQLEIPLEQKVARAKTYFISKLFLCHILIVIRNWLAQVCPELYLKQKPQSAMAASPKQITYRKATINRHQRQPSVFVQSPQESPSPSWRSKRFPTIFSEHWNHWLKESNVIISPYPTLRRLTPSPHQLSPHPHNPLNVLTTRVCMAIFTKPNRCLHIRL